MTDEITLFRQVRPTEPRMTADDRAALRTELFGSDRPGSSRGHHAPNRSHVGSNVTTWRRETSGRREPRRHALVTAAALVAVVGIGGVWVLTTRQSDDTAAPSHDANSTNVADSVAATVDEPLSATPVSSPTVTNSVTATSTSPFEGAFTPLVLAWPPTGLMFLSAGFDPGPGGTGIARYGSAEHATQLQIINRNDPDGDQRMIELGRTPIQAHGRTIYPDGEGSGACLHDACSIGIQWDDDTFTSLRWVNVEGGNLLEGSTLDSLVDLVPTLVSDPSLWSPTGPTER